MNYNNPTYKKTVYGVHITCTLLFLFFWFCYLYFVQDNLLATAQHVFSGGKTTYSRLWGALIISGLLWILQIGVNRLLSLKSLSYAFSFFPSCLVLAVLTDVNPSVFAHFSLGVWSWLFPLLLLLYFFAASFLKYLREPQDFKGPGIFFSVLLPNLVITVCFCFFVGATGNTNDTLHYTYRVENALAQNDMEKALEIGSKSDATSPALNALRAYALSCKGELGSKLFTYPQPYGSRGLLLMLGDTLGLMFRPQEVFHYLGVRPANPAESPAQFLSKAIVNPHAKPAMRDYYLCMLLLDKKLDQFAREIPRYYKLDVSLPLHYKEALVLYSRIAAHPLYVFHDNVEDAAYEDMAKLEKQYRYFAVRRNYVRREFGKTYWYYYRYASPRL